MFRGMDFGRFDKGLSDAAEGRREAARTVPQTIEAAAKSNAAPHEKLVLVRRGHYIAPLGYLE